MRTEPLSMTETVLTTLISQVDYIATNAPASTTESNRFLSLRGLVKNLSGAVLIEKRQYPQALAAFQEMLQLAQDTNDTVNSALALTRIGWELNRAGDGKGGLEALEQARELTFSTGKALASVVACYLARVYAVNGEEGRYARTMNTALEQAHHLGETYLSTADHNYWSQSFIAFGHVDALIKLGRTNEVMDASERYAELVAIESNPFQDVGVTRMQAHALVLNGELEESAKLLREYFAKCIRMQSARDLGDSTKVIQAMKDAGYGQETEVAELENELREIVMNDPHMKNALD
jgi:tetratricopeptide (TPR) repeat protein